MSTISVGGAKNVYALNKFYSLSCTCRRVRRSFFVWIIFFILHADTAFCVPIMSDARHLMHTKETYS